MSNNNKKYGMEDLELSYLEGKFIVTAEINHEKDLVVLKTNEGPVYLTWEGDCCAQCYLAHVDGAEALVGATIVSIESSNWKNVKQEDEYDVLETMGTKIKTTKGRVSFETRLSHNGYYSGSIIVSNDEPIDAYSSPRYDLSTGGKLPHLTALKDF